MRRRHDRVIDSFRDLSSSAVKRFTLFFAEGCVESLIGINDALKDAKDAEDFQLEQDIQKLMEDLGIREIAKDE